MAVVVPPIEQPLGSAVASYWSTLIAQAAKVEDRGNRAAVTSGKQMDGFRDLVSLILEANGIEKTSIYTKSARELPGYFRASKDWDLVIVHKGHLVAAIEFKSQRGPSFGNNFNNRTEEAIGNATDLWVAFREGAFGAGVPRPWLGWVMLLEDCARSTKPVRIVSPHFDGFPEFKNASYAKRYEILLQKLVAERLYDSAAFLMSKSPESEPAAYSEPAEDLTMRRLLASLAGHAGAFVASLQ